MQIPKFIGEKIIELKTIDSTNNYATKLLKEQSCQNGIPDIAEGTIVIAKEQVSGQGQINNKWESEKEKNLTLSLIIYPQFISPDLQFYISKAISLGVADYISRIVKNVKIKWPNDIYVNNRKIAGILIENTLRGNSILSSIIGIGLNVNQTIFISDAPNPISLKQLTKADFNLKECLNNLCSCIEFRYLQLFHQQFDIIDNDYIKHLYKHNILSLFKSNIPENKNIPSQFYGKIINLEKSGKLIIKTEKGDELKFSFKEISFLQ